MSVKDACPDSPVLNEDSSYENRTAGEISGSQAERRFGSEQDGLDSFGARQGACERSDTTSSWFQTV